MSNSLKQRISTGLLIAIPILLCVIYNNTSRIILLSLLTILISFEYLNLNYSKGLKNPLILISCCTGIALLFLAYSTLIDPFYFIVIGVIWNLIMIVDLYMIEIPKLRTNSWLISILYIVIPFCCIISSANTGFFMEIVIGSLILIWTSDISAYFVGKSIGKHKLMPSVSPGKTWEGFFGAGMITCIVSYILSSFFDNFNIQTWVLIGLSTWLFGSVGDLVESKIKRKLNIKDSGSILPGHGGFLDRFDGYFFSLPFTFLIILIKANI